MFKTNISDAKQFWIYFFMLMVTGFVLFVLGVLLYAPFKDLVIALDSKDSAPIVAWMTSGALALLLGSFWLCFYILFETSKKGLINLIHKK